MVIEPGQETPWFTEWILPALGIWLLVGLILVVVGVGIALLFAVIGRGPGPGYRTVSQRLREATVDLLSTSPRRVFALAHLAVREAVRKKVFVALALFAVVLAFAAWYMNPGGGNEPAALYLDFVLFWAITVPVLVVAVFLAAFSLPGDIANHTLYTIVTKPVRPTEIVLGRILGFTAIGSVMLLFMGIVGYFFITRSLDHQHSIAGAGLTRVKLLAGADAVDEGDRMVFRGKTSSAQGHVHQVEIDIAKGEGRFIGLVNQHWHPIYERRARQGKTGSIDGCRAESMTADSQESPKPNATAGASRDRIRVHSPNHHLANGDIVRITGVRGTEAANDVWVVDQVEEDSFALKESEFYGEYEPGSGEWRQIAYEVGPPQGFITARVGHYADNLRFLRRDGTYSNEGVNVGDEWGYRSSIEGGTGMAAEYHFSGLDKSLADANGNVKLQLNLGVFRTIKGDIEKPVNGALELVRPDLDFISDKIPFLTSEFELQELTIPRERAGHSKQTGSRTENATLFGNYVQNGQLVVRISSPDRMQYLSVAKLDVYLLAAPANPVLNFVKGCVSVWFQLVLVTSVGVAFSTFLNGFVALLATGATTLMSIQIDRLREVADAKTVGGASFESFFRVLTRSAMTTDLDPNSMTTPVIVWLDSGVRFMINLALKVLPDLPHLSSVNIVAQGYSVPWNNLFVQFFTLLGFVIPLCLFAHYVLKGREIAA